MLSSPIQMTTMLTYASGFNPTTEVEPFFAGIHTVSLLLCFGAVFVFFVMGAIKPNP